MAEYYNGSAGGGARSSTQGKDPAQVFAKAVKDLHGHLVKQRGVDMLMWADRFIDGKVFKYGKWEASMNKLQGGPDYEEEEEEEEELEEDEEEGEE